MVIFIKAPSCLSPMTVAVITPVYATPENGRLGLLRKTMESVRGQTAPYVHLIVDDGSPINVKEVIDGQHNPNVKYMQRERKSDDQKTSANAINAGIEQCLSNEGSVLTPKETSAIKAITYLHSDDLYTPNSLQSRMDHLGNNGMVYTDIACVENNKVSRVVIGGEEDASSLLKPEKLFQFPHHTAMWRRDFLQYTRDYATRFWGQKGVFDPSLRCAEDFDATISFLQAAGEGDYGIRYVPEFSVLYRSHDAAMHTSTGTLERFDQLNGIFSKHFGDMYNMADVISMRLGADLPWSLLTFLPEKMKDKLRPIKNRIKRKDGELDRRLRDVEENFVF